MTDKQEFNDLVAVGDLDIMAEAGQPGLYDAICDAAQAIVRLPTQRERLGAVEFLACELRGYLAGSGLSESGQREIIARLVSELHEVGGAPRV